METICLYNLQKCVIRTFFCLFYQVYKLNYGPAETTNCLRLQSQTDAGGRCAVDI